MKTFKDPIAPKMKKSSEAFVGPSKEQATTGRFMPAGDDYGVGFRTPTGTFKASSKGPIPMESKCYDPEEI